MNRLVFFEAEALDVRKNMSRWSTVRELWFKKPNGGEGSVEYSADLPIRRGNKIGLVFDTKHNHHVAIVNFSTEQYYNRVPEVESAAYDPFPNSGWFDRWFFRQTLTSPYGSETVEFHRSVEDIIAHAISEHRSRNVR